LTFALTLLGACAVAPSARVDAPTEPQQPWFLGRFAGTSVTEVDGKRFEDGTGYVELRADGTFSLHFRFSSESGGGFDWDATGPWVLRSPPEDAGWNRGSVHLELSPATANGSIARGATGTAVVTRDGAFFGVGPGRLGFTLWREL
jgi:hypothetical protein